jgi:hypothetical protein
VSSVEEYAKTDENQTADSDANDCGNASASWPKADISLQFIADSWRASVLNENDTCNFVLLNSNFISAAVLDCGEGSERRLGIEAYVAW